MMRRYHLHIPDETTESELKEMFKAKQYLTEEAAVLKRVGKQKKKQYQNLQENLQQVFQILPESTYQFDQEKKIVYELVAEDAVVNLTEENDEKAASDIEKKDVSTSQRYAKRIHKQLQNETQVRKLLQLTRDKKLVHEQMRSIQALRVEKEYELGRINKVMASKFAMTPEGIYSYDDESMTLYEVVNLQRPQGKQRPAGQQRAQTREQLGLAAPVGK